MPRAVGVGWGGALPVLSGIRLDLAGDRLGIAIHLAATSKDDNSDDIAELRVLSV